MDLHRPPIGYVRPLVPDDIPEVVRLYARVFGPLVADSLDGLQSTFREVFLNHPWSDQDLPSLVYQEKNQRIVGCLGVMPRPMSMNGRPIRAAIGHTFMVDPASRSTPAAMELLCAYLSGPQDVSMARGTGVSRRMFEAFGGSTSLLYSIGWTRVLRPGRYVLSFLTRHGLPALAAHALAPVSYAADVVTSRLLRNPCQLLEPRLSGMELDAETLRKCMAEFSSGRSLRPTYEAGSLRWLLELLDHRSGGAPFRKIVVRDSSQEIVGYYLYYLNPEGVGDVVQIGAHPGSIEEVFDCLGYDAQQDGLMAVSGQLEPLFLPALSARHCLLGRRDGSSLLVHSKDPDLIAPIYRGDAFLTRLEGDWWIGSVLRGAASATARRD